MTVLPSARPSVISTASPSTMPLLIGLKRAVLPSATNTPRVPSTSTIALRGTVRASARSRTTNCTRAYIPGLSLEDGLGTSTSIWAVRVAGSSTGERRATRPLNTSPGYASTSTCAGMSMTIRRRSFSTRFATRRTKWMSTTDRNDELVPTKAPGSRRRLPTKPSTGERIRVFERLMRSSSSLAAAWLPWALARSTWASAASYLASASSSVCRATRLRPNRFRERSRLLWAFLRSASRCRTVALDTSSEASFWRTCSRSSRSSSVASNWPRRTGSPRRTLTASMRPLTLGTTSTVTAPIRFPTTMTRSATPRRFAVVVSTVIVGRKAPPPGAPPPRPPPPPGCPAAACAGDAPSADPGLKYIQRPSATATATIPRMSALRIRPARVPQTLTRGGCCESRHIHHQTPPAVCWTRSNATSAFW